MRLTVAGAATYRGAHAGGNVGVEKIDVKTHMQVGVGVHQRQRQLHGGAHAHLVDETHVKHVQPGLVHQAFFALVDAAYANLAHPFGTDGGYLAADAGQHIRAISAQASHRHAVDVAAGGERVGVEVGVGVQPQHPQFLTDIAAMPGHRADRAQPQTVIPPQHDGQAVLLQFGIHRIVQRLVPGGHLVQMPVAVHRGQPGVGRAAQVATVNHVQAMALQHRDDVGHAQGLRAHAGTTAARANVSWRADKRDVGIHGAALYRESTSPR